MAPTKILFGGSPFFSVCSSNFTELEWFKNPPNFWFAKGETLMRRSDPFALRESMQNLKKGHSHLTLPLMRCFLLTFFFFFEMAGSWNKLRIEIRFFKGKFNLIYAYLDGLTCIKNNSLFDKSSEFLYILRCKQLALAIKEMHAASQSRTNSILQNNWKCFTRTKIVKQTLIN